jgi:SAM-dependent methyltransferase
MKLDRAGLHLQESDAVMRSNREWQYWGREDPLYGVITRPGREATKRGWQTNEFFGHGEAEFASVRDQWEHYGREPGRCVEIGCGAGRMTRQLLKYFDEVVALDVAEGQIAKAHEILGSDAGRVQFHLVDEPDIPVPDQSCDAMFSSEVFQHFAVFDGVTRYLELTFSKLRPGASACFHLPVIGAHELSMRRVAYFYARRKAIAVRRWFGARRLMDYRVAVPTEVFRTCRRIGYHDTQLRVFPAGVDGENHSYFFARKPVNPQYCVCGHDLISQHHGTAFCWYCNCRRPRV